MLGEVSNHIYYLMLKLKLGTSRSEDLILHKKAKEEGDSKSFNFYTDFNKAFEKAKVEMENKLTATAH